MEESGNHSNIRFTHGTAVKILNSDPLLPTLERNLNLPSVCLLTVPTFKKQEVRKDFQAASLE